MKLKDYEYYKNDLGVQYKGESLEVLKAMPNESVNCVITSPPYWNLRDYGIVGQLGLEKTFQEYINRLCNIFDEVKRVLKKDGTCWVVLGDTYNNNPSNQGTANTGNAAALEQIGRMNRLQDGLAAKSLCQIPSRFGIEMTNRGWILRNKIIWYKRNCMPSSAKDRFTVDFEYVHFFVKNEKYWFNQQFEKYLIKENRPAGIVRNREYNYDSKLNAMNKKKYSLRQKRGGNKNLDYYNSQGKNKRTVWNINTQPFPDAHSAVFPEKLVETPIKAGCPKDGIVMDIFSGSGTVHLVAEKLNRKSISIDLSGEYCEMEKNRIEQYRSKGIKMDMVL